MVNDDQAFVSWLCVTWVVLALCQLAVTVAGNLAVIPLTGVTFPFVSFGMTSLVVNMAMLGLAINVNVPARGRAWLSAARLTLLQFAIAASAAVVPVLLAVLLIVASARQADGATPAREQRSPRERAPGRRAEDVRARDRPPRPGAAPVLPIADDAARARSAMPRRVGWPRRHARPRAARCWRARPTTARRRRRAWPRSSTKSTQALLRLQQRRRTGASATPSASTRARWFDAVATALQTPIEAPDYPGVRFTRAVRRHRERRGDARARRTAACSRALRGAAPRSSA